MDKLQILVIIMVNKYKNCCVVFFALTLITIGCKTNYNKVEIIKAEKFFRNAEKTFFQISPDGNNISFLKPVNDKLNLFIIKNGQKEEIQLTNLTDHNIYNYFWGNDNKIVYAYDNNGDEKYQIYSVDINTKQITTLVKEKESRVSIIDLMPDIKDEILIAISNPTNNMFDAYKLNIETGNLTLALKNPGNITGWHTDHNGVIRIITTTDGVNTGILYRNNQNESFKLSTYSDFRDEFVPLNFTADNKYVYALSNHNRDKIALVKYDFKTNKEIDVIYQNSTVDVKDAVYSTSKKKIIYVNYVTYKRQNYFTDNDYLKIDKNLRNQLPGKEIEIINTSLNEDNLIIRSYSDKSLGAYYLYTVAQNKLLKLADLSPWIDENQMAEMKPISYKSRDNKTIFGYLSVPVGVEPKNLPTVILPHGGPWLRDVWGFNKDVQFLTNRGYAVLQMNYRGSKGYGKQFYEAGFKEWGAKMQDDITDGTEWLIRQGIADSNRIAIYGYSYGGYASLMGIVNNPKLYKCGVSYCGVINLVSFLKSVPPAWAPFKEMLHEIIGNPETDSLKLVNTSPFYNIQKIKVPLLIAQGANDPKVNITEINLYVNKMKSSGIDVQYIVKNDEGHGFENENNRLDFYRELEKFLAKNINGRTE